MVEKENFFGYTERFVGKIIIIREIFVSIQ